MELRPQRGSVPDLDPLREENERLRSTIASLRTEMEALQGGGNRPAAVMPLIEELRSSDGDLNQALEYIHVLQQASNSTVENSDGEVRYLRQKVHVQCELWEPSL